MSLKMRRRTPLEEASLFTELTAEQKREVELAGSRRTVLRGRYFFEQGQPSQGLHVLLSGRLKSSRLIPGGQEIVLHFIEAGQVFGEIPAFLKKNYPATAQAVEDSEVFTLPLKALERLTARQPEIAMRIMRGMARKLVVLLDRIEIQKGMKAEARVARYIVASLGTSLAVGARFNVPGSKKTWAAELGLQPESLSRSFSRLAEIGAIRVVGKDIEVRDPVCLATLAGARRANSEDDKA